MVGASVLDGTRFVEISDLVKHDFFPKKVSYRVIATLHAQTLGNLVTIITSRKKYCALNSYAKHVEWGADTSLTPPPPTLKYPGEGENPPMPPPSSSPPPVLMHMLDENH